ncbi:MAG: hypothetical protein IKU28_02290 [Erysipelotrichaceae bacterium]|nr:hypothetical protein [Erysipelotrichaceae bacterium]
MITRILNEIESCHYWDARLLKLDCNYFGDEISLCFGDKNIEYEFHFIGCFEIGIKHDYQYSKKTLYRNLKIAQIPFFIQDIKLDEKEVLKEKYYEFLIDAYPLSLKIVCKQFEIKKTV